MEPGEPTGHAYVWLAATVMLAAWQLSGAQHTTPVLRTILAAGVCGAAVVVLAAWRDKSNTQTQLNLRTSHSLDPAVRTATTHPTVRGDLFTLRPPPDADPLSGGEWPRHLALRRRVVGALKAVRGLQAHNRGELSGVVWALSDFYARYDAALLAEDDGQLARRAARTLLDTRDAALRGLHALALAAVDDTSEASSVHAAISIVGNDTLRCIGVLVRKHGNVRGSLRAEALTMLPPYAFDPAEAKHAGSIRP